MQIWMIVKDNVSLGDFSWIKIIEHFIVYKICSKWKKYFYVLCSFLLFTKLRLSFYFLVDFLITIKNDENNLELNYVIIEKIPNKEILFLEF